jgi:hypothetical protein
MDAEELYPDAQFARRLIAGIVAFLLIMAAIGFGSLAFSPDAPVTTPAATSAKVTLDSYYESPGGRALDWAEGNAFRHWYAYGGTGPNYDCSGLVMESVGHATGIWLPRTAYGMTHNWHLYRVSYPQRGDIVAWGYPYTYHVMFKTIWNGVAFGALDSGHMISWYGIWNTWGVTYWRLR